MKTAQLVASCWRPGVIRTTLGVVTFCALLLNGVVQAQFSYTVNANQTVTITGYTGTIDVVAIPSTIDGLPVTSIGYGAFFDTSINQH